MINKKKIQFFKKFLDTLIPESKKFRMPKFSKAVDIKNFIREIYTDLQLKKTLDRIMINQKFKFKKNNSRLITKLEKYLSFMIICKYYSSPIVLKKLTKYEIHKSKNSNR